MKIISDGEYDDLMLMHDKLEFARSEAMVQTEKIILLSASLKKSDEHAEALKRAMLASALQLEFWYRSPASPEGLCHLVAAELRKAAS